MKNITSIVSSTIGNVLEWYDFGLFTIFSSVFSKIFFPSNHPDTALLATFGIFSVGFICRPIGALWFGYLGDTMGRAKTLRLSILMITLPTLLIGLLPTYHQAGIMAPLALIFTRILQGISIGGEYSGNLVYLAETVAKNYRARMTSLVSVGANFGILLAALVGIASETLFTDEQLRSWGWRIPYLLSGIICLVVYCTRLKFPETHIFNLLKQKKQIPHNPIKVVFTNNIHQLLRTLALVCMGSTFYYFCFIYIPVFLSHNLKMPIQQVSILMSSLIAMMMLGAPLGGYLCDTFGRRKMLLFNVGLVILLAIPGFYFLQFHIFITQVIILALFTLTSSFEQGTTPIAVVENFPPPARYTGVSLGYNIGNGLLGGTVPIICEWLYNKHSIVAPALYITICAALTGLVIFFYVPETKGINLVKEAPSSS